MECYGSDVLWMLVLDTCWKVQCLSYSWFQSRPSHCLEFSSLCGWCGDASWCVGGQFIHWPNRSVKRKAQKSKKNESNLFFSFFFPLNNLHVENQCNAHVSWQVFILRTKFFPACMGPPSYIKRISMKFFSFWQILPIFHFLSKFSD